MTSKYSILTITQANQLVNYDLTKTGANGTSRKYDDDWIYDRITDGELDVFGFLHQTYTADTIPDDLLQAIRTMVKIHIKNQLIEDGQLKNADSYDPIAYFNTYLKPNLLNRMKKATSLSAGSAIDDYEYST